MRTSTGALILACSILLTLCFPSLAAGSSYQSASLLRHAKDLFRQVQRPPGFTGRCSIQLSWSRQAVDHETARRHLGVRVIADLIAAHTQIVPADVIDPEGRNREWFCDRNTSAPPVAEIAEARLREGSLPDNGTVGSIEYAFPIFNANFTRAVVVVTHRSSGRRQPDGHFISSMDGDTTAHVYEKRGGAWRFRTSQNYSAWH